MASIMDLAKKHCVPCEGGIAPFDPKNAQAYLKNVKGWELVDDNKKIQKDFVLNNFVEAVDFVNKVAEIAETEDHHPDLFVHSYKKLRITLSTHAIGGLSENDFILAAKIDALEV
jgi:4a-hydroxytetrahydrobiopterin dehydratase